LLDPRKRHDAATDELARLSAELADALEAHRQARRLVAATDTPGAARGATLTREEALMLLHDHWEDECYLALWAEAPSGQGTLGVIELRGPLTNTLGIRGAASRPDETRDIMGTLYMIGGHPFMLPALPGTIRERDNGLDFELTDGLKLRIGWTTPEVRPHGDS
jgi:hypothetical protein